MISSRPLHIQNRFRDPHERDKFSSALFNSDVIEVIDLISPKQILRSLKTNGLLFGLRVQTTSGQLVHVYVKDLK